MKREAKVPKKEVGEAAEIRYGIHSSPFGRCVIGVTKRRVCILRFLEKNSDKEAVQIIKETWSKDILVRDDRSTGVYAKKIFSSGKKSHIPLILKGTNFQMRVWEALLAIPEGRVTSYADLARAIGKPKASRAVGSACGKNAITYLVPCHRVLTSAGGLGGYNGGVKRKEAMLEWEAARGK